MKKFFGTDTYVQSAGIHNDLEIDGFAISVCSEIGVVLDRHRSRSFEEMEELGDQLSSFDLVVALSSASQSQAQDLTRFYHTELEYWPITDPTAQGESREAKLEAYRVARDEIIGHLINRWGPARSE